MINKGYYCELLEAMNRTETILTAQKIVKMYVDTFQNSNKLYEQLTALRLTHSQSNTLLSSKICFYCEMILVNLREK